MLNINTQYLGFFELKKKRGTPSLIVIHHTCTKTPAKTRSALKNQGYSTHFEVDTDGTIYQYADVMYVASHCGSANYYAIGIDVTHLENAKFPEAQVQAVENLVDFLCEKYGISHVVTMKLEGIVPHCALCVTKCPNGFPMERLNKPVPSEEEEDFDVIKRLDQLIGMALVDGRREEARELCKRRLGL